MKEAKNNIEFLKLVLEETKKTVKSLNDIILFKDLPFFYPQNEQDYIKMFGKPKINEYVSHIELTQKTRYLAKKLTLGERAARSNSEDALILLATAFSGLGECGEKSHFALCKLLEKNCPYKISLIVMNGIEGYNHAAILVDCPDFDETPSIEEIEQLDEKCILFDPLFEVIGGANQIKFLLKDIFTFYKLHTISDCKKFDVTAHRDMVLLLLQKAKGISDEIRKNLSLTEFKKPPAVSLEKNPDLEKIKQKINDITGLEWKYYPKHSIVLYFSKDSKEISQLIKKFGEVLNIKRKKTKCDSLSEQNFVASIDLLNPGTLGLVDKHEKIKIGRILP